MGTASPALPARPTRETYGPNPTSIDIPFSPGRTLWTGVSVGVRVTVRIDKAAPKVGEPVRFDVEMSSPGNMCCGLWLITGDGAIIQKENGFGCPGGGPQGPGPVHFGFTHIYNRDGRWPFRVDPTTGNCDVAAVSPPPTLFGTVEVAPGTSTLQGPSLPSVALHGTTRPAGHEADLHWASVVGFSRDDDGWLRTLSLDWGDGSKPLVLEATWPCRQGVSGWPAVSHLDFNSDDAIHYYADPGTYTLTLTAVSSACDESTRQTGTATLNWRVPPPG